MIASIGVSLAVGGGPPGELAGRGTELGDRQVSIVTRVPIGV